MTEQATAAFAIAAGVPRIEQMSAKQTIAHIVIRSLANGKPYKSIIFGPRPTQLAFKACKPWRKPLLKQSTQRRLSTSSARTVAALRPSSPSFSKIFPMCFFTVFSAMPSRMATSPLPCNSRIESETLIRHSPPTQTLWEHPGLTRS
jgi:hypothetical protein